MSAITSSNPDHNMISVWPPGPSLPVPIGRGGIVRLSERSGYLDYQKKKNIYIYIYIYLLKKYILKLKHNFIIILNFNRHLSMSGGKGTSAEVPAITSSNPGHNGFNMVSIWPPEPFSSVSVGRGGIVGLSERSEYLDYQKNNIYIYIYIYIFAQKYILKL